MVIVFFLVLFLHQICLLECVHSQYGPNEYFFLFLHMPYKILLSFIYAFNLNNNKFFSFNGRFDNRRCSTVTESIMFPFKWAHSEWFFENLVFFKILSIIRFLFIRNIFHSFIAISIHFFFLFIDDQQSYQSNRFELWSGDTQLHWWF